MKPTTIAVDLAKSVFEVAVSRRVGEVEQRKRLTRAQFGRFLRESDPADIVMEACGTAHYWAREASQHGHRVRLLPAHDVKRYVGRNKTDAADAKALLEAARNRDLKPIPVKSIDQHVITRLHRLRSAWVSTRTARLNTLRGPLRELGITIPVGARQVVPAVHALISDAESEVPEALRPVLAEAVAEIGELERRVQEVALQLESMARANERIRRLTTIPGIGVLTATAIVGFVGDLHRFPSGRHFASYLGLTPRERSSGTTRRLGAISKRGDIYLRTLLIHGARLALLAAKRTTKPRDRLRRWALDREKARGHNKAAVALANKLARIVWAIEKKGDEGYASADAITEKD